MRTPRRVGTTIAAVLAGGLASGLVAAAPAAAATSPTNAGARCAQAGISTLKSLGLFQAAAKQQIDYSTLADPVNGPIFTSLPAGSYLSLGQVVKLHHTNPELFAWCR